MNRKHIIAAVIIVMTAFISMQLVSAFARSASHEFSDKSVSGLWVKYQNAREKDLPTQQKACLDEIISISLQQKMPADYYNAVLCYNELNFHKGDNLENIIQQGIDTFGPLVDYLLMTSMKGQDCDIDFILANEDELQHSYNKAFYKKIKDNPYNFNRIRKIPEFIIDNISSDYEFLLWYTYFFSKRNYYSDVQVAKRALNLLKSQIGTAYPEGVYAEFCQLSDNADIQGLKSFEQKYSNKALSLYATLKILESRRDTLVELQSDPMTKEQKRQASLQVQRLVEDFEAVFRKSRTFKKNERDIVAECGDIRGRAKYLLERSAYVILQGHDVELVTSNIPYVDVRLVRDSLSGATVFNQRIDNLEGSVYFNDTLRFTIPSMDDGNYVLCIQSDDFERHNNLRLSRISVAQTKTESGNLFFICDAYSGEPIDVADVVVVSGNDTLKTIHNQMFSGWTSLDVDYPKDRSVVNYFQTFDRQGFKMIGAQVVQFEDFRADVYEDECKVGGKVLTDRAAYHPGDTLEFKSILWKANSEGPYAVEDSGQLCKVVLADSENKTIADKVLRLNDFGSCAGEFVLPEGLRNGSFSLSVYKDNEFVAMSSVYVGEFVLPDFKIRFAEDSRLTFLGEVLEVKGSVQSYTGHPLSQAIAEYSLRLGERTVNGRLDLEADGAFSILVNTSDFSDRDYLSCSVKVRVTDGTGKTEEREKYFFLSKILPFVAEFLDNSEGRLELAQGRRHDRINVQKITAENIWNFVVGSNLVKFSESDVEIDYRLKRSGEVLKSGKSSPGDTVSFDLSAMASGLYDVDFKAVTINGVGEEVTAGYNFAIYLSRTEDIVIDGGVERVFRKVEDDNISVLFAAAAGPVWAVYYVTDGYNILSSKIVHVSQPRGVTVASLPWEDSFPDTVTAYLIYFKDGHYYRYDASFCRSDCGDNKLPLHVSLMSENVSPCQRYVLNISGLPKSEFAVSVFDKRTESIRSNYWYRDTKMYRVPYLSTYILTPSSYYNWGWHPSRYACLSKSSNALDISVRGESDFMEYVLEEEVVQCVDAGAVEVRDGFAKTLCFEPQIRSGIDGNAEVEFMTGDELSTFVVSVYGHNRLMLNNILRDEFVVTIPVKVSVAVPQFLYLGDEYDMSIALSNSSDKLVGGTLVCELYDSDDYRSSRPLSVISRPVEVGAKAGAVVSVPVRLSGLLSSETISSDLSCSEKLSSESVLGVKLTFRSDSFSDAVFVKVPVRKPVQTLTEAHSLVQPVQMSDAQAYEALSGDFVNTSAYGAVFSSKSFEDIVSDFYFEPRKLDSYDVVSCTNVIYNSLYSNYLRSKGLVGSVEGDVTVDSLAIGLDKQVVKAVDGLISCANDDGGFGWIPGMKSNVYMTEFVLYNMVLLSDRGLWSDYVADSGLGNILDSAIKYLDKIHMGDKFSMDYIFIRSMAGNISPWTGNALDVIKIDTKNRQYIVNSLTDYATSRGDVRAKLVNVSLLLNLLCDDCDLAKSYGFNAGNCNKLRKSLAWNIESLVDYAVPTSYGAYYFPDVVLPTRGLLSSDAFIHAMAIRVFDNLSLVLNENRKLSNHLINNLLVNIDDVKKGLYLWIMMQKESQYWTGDPSFCEAMSTLLSAPGDLKKTKIAVLSKTYTKPFDAIKQMSEGMSLSVKYCRKFAAGDFEELSLGDRLSVGDKIYALYSVESETSRSFVRFSAARPAGVRPVNQLSGWEFYSDNVSKLRPLHILYGSCYRDVKSDRTVFWFDVLPEGKTELLEELVVTQSGTYRAAASELVCEYAPGYRSNTSAPSPLTFSAYSREFDSSFL